jgi:hypothetical protein
LSLQGEHCWNGWGGHGRIVRMVCHSVKTRENTGLDRAKEGHV